MPISADQWRVAVGCHNIKRHRQIDLKRFFLEKIIFGGNSKLAQLYSVLQEVQKDAEICHSGTLNANPTDPLDEVAVIIMAYSHVCAEVLQCFLSMVTLQLAGDVETNPDPVNSTGYFKSYDEGAVLVMMAACHQVLQCFVFMVTLQLLLLAGDVETNPGPDLTIDELKMSDEQLDTPITAVELQDLAACFDNTYSYVGQFNLLEFQETDIKSRTDHQGTQAGMVYLLQCWRNKDPNEATFRKLLCILLSMKPIKGAVAIEVCKHLDKKHPKPLHSGDGMQKRFEKQGSGILIAEKLEHSHLQALLETELWDIRVNWKEVGDGLRLSDATMNEIKFDSRLHNDGQRFQVVLKKWIQTDQAEIHTLLEVLKGKIVHRVDIANHICRSKNRSAVGLCLSRCDACFPNGPAPPEENLKSPSPNVLVQQQNAKIEKAPSVFVQQQQNAVDTKIEVKKSSAHTQKAPGVLVQQQNAVDTKNEHMQVYPYCTLMEKECKKIAEPSAPGTQSGIMAYGKRWPSEYKTLNVFFMNANELTELKLNTLNIMQWAKLWSAGGREIAANCVPKFEEVDTDRKAHIRVLIQIGGSSSSKLGREALNVRDMSVPTMYLGLKNGMNNYNQHLVVHEFGHALGLQHEHQRSQFLHYAVLLLDKNKMREHFEKNAPKFDFEEQCLAPKTGDTDDNYDCKSVMHYWFLLSWLKDEHNIYEKLSEVIALPAGIKRDVLIGLHNNADPEDLATSPSPQDYEFLERCYSPSNRDNIPQLPKPAATTDVTVTDSLVGQGDNIPQLPKPAAATTDVTDSLVGQGQQHTLPLIVPQSGVYDPSSLTSRDTVAAISQTRTDTIDQINDMIKVATKFNKTDIAEKLSNTLTLLKSKHTKVGIVGLSKSGKSTTINALLGDEYLPSSEMVETAYVLCIKQDPQSEPTLYDKTDPENVIEIAVGVDDIYEKLKKLNETRRKGGSGCDIKKKFELSVPLIQGLTDYTELEIYDTPGISERKPGIRQDAEQMWDEVEGIILVLSVETVESYQTVSFTQLEKYKNDKKDKRRILVLMNKQDKMFQNKKNRYTNERLKEKVEKIVPVPWNEVAFYSAKCSLDGRQLKKLTTVDSDTQQSYIDLHSVVVKYSELKEEAQKISNCSKENIEKLAELAERASNIAKIEQVFKESFIRFKDRKAIDDATHQVAQLLQHAKQQHCSSSVEKLESIQKSLNSS